MITIRYARFGRTNRPSYRIVVQEKRRAPSSTVLETIGHYDPVANPAVFEVKADRVVYWVEHGAQVSDSLFNMLLEKGILKGTKRKVASGKKAEEAAQPAEPNQSASAAESAPTEPAAPTEAVASDASAPSA